MKLLLLTVGKMRSAPLAEVCADYLARLKRFGPTDLKEIKASTRADARGAVDEESERLAAVLEPGDKLVVLDERGTQMTSVQLADWLGKCERENVKRLVIALGGAHGMSDEIKARGMGLGLSKLTLPHELCRAVALEQLYRARTIQNRLPYHHA